MSKRTKERNKGHVPKSTVNPLLKGDRLTPIAQVKRAVELSGNAEMQKVVAALDKLPTQIKNSVNENVQNNVAVNDDVAEQSKSVGDSCKELVIRLSSVGKLLTNEKVLASPRATELGPMARTFATDLKAVKNKIVALDARVQEVNAQDIPTEDKQAELVFVGMEYANLFDELSTKAIPLSADITNIIGEIIGGEEGAAVAEVVQG